MLCVYHEWVGEGACPHCKPTYNALYRDKPITPKAAAPIPLADTLRQRSALGANTEFESHWSKLLGLMDKNADKGLYTLPAGKGLNLPSMEQFRSELIAKLQAEGFSVSTYGDISWSPEPNEPQPAMTWLEKLILKIYKVPT